MRLTNETIECVELSLQMQQKQKGTNMYILSYGTLGAAESRNTSLFVL